ncbi:hypothetical protein CWB99_15905 [Pseudoalteromonas rubra]|uniref:Uncharacterized protein n=1 Tax=Pseudoalteromonas rubra TaxID=43658 RepID=A0A5S3WL18_9GAMM|nr:hypothetical protein [Pseudoalteromonas rubra]TMP27200.1 hypothetical protein CWB99_15905 [Pseudoalteromonas rubra]TMP29496.1 hypothetical protein CWC00_19000 [Pseudoalteromonas rubra]
MNNDKVTVQYVANNQNKEIVFELELHKNCTDSTSIVETEVYKEILAAEDIDKSKTIPLTDNEQPIPRYSERLKLAGISGVQYMREGIADTFELR